MDNTCEVQLLNDIKSGDHVAFKKVIDLYADALFIYVERRINSREDSQEIVQDIFCSLWKNCKKITIQDSLGPYLYKAAKFEIIDWIRSNSRSQTKLKDLAYHLPNANESIEEQFIANELGIHIQNEVRKMPKTMQEVYQLSRVENMPIKEIANHLALSEQTVKNNITLAISKLKLKLKVF